MAIPDFLSLSSEEEYRQFFIDNYCNKSPILTWDGLPVMFYPEMFDHAFFKRKEKTWRSQKDQVDFERCKRMLWIEEVLNDSTIVPRQGYDKATGRNDSTRRVTLVSKERYVVVIRYTGKNKCAFVTAYIIDNERTYKQLMTAPRWVGV